MLKIKDYVNSYYLDDDYTFSDITRIVKVCAKHNIKITEAEAEELWSSYSDDYCAGWLGLPNDDATLFGVIIYKAKELWKSRDE